MKQANSSTGGHVRPKVPREARRCWGLSLGFYLLRSLVLFDGTAHRPKMSRTHFPSSRELNGPGSNSPPVRQIILLHDIDPHGQVALAKCVAQRK